MLVELTIRNFAVIKETRIEFGPGLNALTGETGAGKSIVLDALGAVLGERTSPSVIRAGEIRAYVEAIFDLHLSANQQRIATRLSEAGIDIESDDLLILSRDITMNRSTARINGRAVTAGALTEIGELLVDIHGQSDHLSLLRPADQLDMLDSFAATHACRQRLGELFHAWRSTIHRIAQFDTDERERVQRQGYLKLQLREIEDVSPHPDEDDELDAERQRLTHAVRLMALAEDTRSTIEGNSAEDPNFNGALDQLRQAESTLEEMTRLDSSTGEFLRQLRDSLFTLDEMSSDLREYLGLLEVDPERLDLVNQRLQDIRGLTRKYGASIDEVLAHAATIREELDQLNASSSGIDELRNLEQRQAMELADLGAALSHKRSKSGNQLAKRIEATISELNMGTATFAVSVEQRNDEGGIAVDGRRLAIDATGIDHVAFMLASNPGSSPQPLSRVASGGETARLMLALKSILSEADSTPILIFDEIDVGIGGRSGQIVGEKLWNLSQEHQVIVISHLPQVAAFAEHHSTMVKDVESDNASTVAAFLSGDASVDEIATMFDGKPVSPESRANAMALLRRVTEWKANQSQSDQRQKAG